MVIAAAPVIAPALKITDSIWTVPDELTMCNLVLPECVMEAVAFDIVISPDIPNVVTVLTAPPVNVTSSIRTFTPLEMVNAVLPECVMAAALFDIRTLASGVISPIDFTVCAVTWPLTPTPPVTISVPLVVEVDPVLAVSVVAPDAANDVTPLRAPPIVKAPLLVMAPAPVIALPVNVTSSIRTFRLLEMVNEPPLPLAVCVMVDSSTPDMPILVTVLTAPAINVTDSIRTFTSLETVN